MNFINIVTFYTNKSDRNIEKLAEVYDNKILLSEKIRIIGKGYLDNADKITGKKILLKPNWVLHDRNEHDSICLRTNNNIILALTEILAEKKPSQILIGDAPVQGCDWDKMLDDNFYKSINDLSIQYSVPITVKDFRRVTFDPRLNNPVKERNPLSDYLIFDLGNESYLEQITSNKNKFRVTSYNPDRLAKAHAKGIHKYCITKELLEADLVISIPKIKTHQKTGITGALKNLVGVNGDKDFLPHHRIGGVGFGGDCYPGRNIFRRISEYTLDTANRNQGKIIYKSLFYLSLAIWKISRPKNVHQMAAGWPGNDTTWRMVMDLNKIATFGKMDGTISQKPQRMIYSLCDGIIGGQGDGPLDPKPLPLGIICFSNNSSLNDICMGTLMGFNIQKISLLRNALNEIKNQNSKIEFNNKEVVLNGLLMHSIPTLPPPGWVNYI
ncbi:MAG: DUF362 domain-containing protein [Paludibacter sp.]